MNPNKEANFKTGIVVLMMVTTGVLIILASTPVIMPARAQETYTVGTGAEHATIQGAIDNASAGDTILVWAGTYNENVVVDKMLTLVGNGTANTTIQGGGSGSGSVVTVEADWVNVTGFRITGSGGSTDDAGIYIESVQNCRVGDNIITGNRHGIQLGLSRHNTIENNNVTSNTGTGIRLRWISGLSSSTQNTIANNTVSGNGGGFYFASYNDNNMVINNTVKDNSGNGISIHRSNSNQVIDNIVTNNSIRGISLDRVETTVVEGNHVNHNERGIWIGSTTSDYYSRNNIIRYNTISNNTLHGMELGPRSELNTASHNIISNNSVYGIHFESDLYGRSYRETVEHNTISGNVDQSIFMRNAWQITLRNNTITGHGIYIQSATAEGWNTHTIDENNTLGGRPVYYWKSESGGTVPEDAGQVILASCSDVTIENQNISNATVQIGFSSGIRMENITVKGALWQGIHIYNSPDCNITNSSVRDIGLNGIHVELSNNMHISNVTMDGSGGIYLQDSQQLTVMDSTVINNQRGIYSSSVISDYTIENNTISNNTDDGIYLSSTAAGGNNRIEGNTVAGNGGEGIYLRGLNDGNRLVNNHIMNNNASDNTRYGLYILYSNENTIGSNTFTHNSEDGIYISYSLDNRIENNNASGNYRHGIYLRDSESNLVANNTVNDNEVQHGIILWAVSHTQVENNTVRDNEASNRDGIYLYLSNLNRVANNTVSNSGRYDIYVLSGASNTIGGNTVTTTRSEGIRIAGVASNDNVVADNLVTGPGAGDIDGIVMASPDNRLENNTVRNVRYGIHSSGQRNTISNNTLLDCTTSIYVTGSYNDLLNNTVASSSSHGIHATSHYNLMANNTVENSADSGIYLTGVENNISFNTVLNSTQHGIWLASSDNRADNNTVNGTGSNGILFRAQFGTPSGNVLENNTITNVSQHSIHIYGSISCELYGNTMDSRGLFIEGNDETHWNTHEIDDTNTVGGKPVIYWKNENGGAVPEGAAQVILASCTGVTVENQDIAGVSMGIQLAYSHDNILENNVITGSEYGLHLYQSDNNTLSKNTITNSDYGAYIHYSDINSVSGCKFIHNNRGVLLHFSTENQVLNNELRENHIYGIHIHAGAISGRNNKIYNNAFLNNTVQAESTNHENYWDMGNPATGGLGGNYWSDYEDRYPEAQAFNGVWDTPYVIEGTHQDNYPLTDPIDNEPPVADAGLDQTILQGETVYFNGTGSSDNIGIVSYTWNFTYDGSHVVMSEPTPEYVFIIVGTYTVTLNVSDAAGNWDTDTMTVTVDPDNDFPSADAGANQSVDLGDMVTFNGSASTDNVGITNYTWTFDDEGAISLYGVVQTYQFNNPGVFLVTLNVSDAAGNWAVDNLTVTVNDTEPPVAVAGDDVAIDMGDIVTFNGTESTDNVAVTNYTWTFDDEGAIFLYGVMPTYLFNNPGVFLVTLNVSDEAGNWAVDNLTVTVNDTEAPSVLLVGDPESAVDQHTLVNFTATATDNYSPVENLFYEWFVDGVLQLGGDTSWFNKTFANAGTFVIRVEVTDEAGNTGFNETTYIVNDTESPVAVAGGDQIIAVGVLVEFDGSQSTDNVGIEEYVWTFEDEVLVTLYGVIPTYLFNNPGVFLVTLNVSDEAGNWAEDTLTITVDGEPPTANAGPDQYVDMGSIAGFDASASTDNIGIEEYVWTFEDEVLVTLYGVMPTYLFDNPGVFLVTLNVSDAAGNWAVDNLTVTVNDTEPPVANAGPDITVDMGDIVTFNGSLSTDNVAVTNYTWTLDDEGAIFLYVVMPTYLFDNPGVFLVTLNVSDEAGNWAVDNLTVTVNDTEPPVAVAGEDVTTNRGTLVTFDGSASTDNIVIENYTWTFTHNNTDITLYGKTTNYTFWTPGNYTITLTVTDAAGNTNIDTKNIHIQDTTTPDPKPEDPTKDTVTITIGPLLDTDGNPIAGATITTTINGKEYTNTTNINGSTTLTIPVTNKEINITITKTGFEAIQYQATTNEDGTTNPPPPTMRLAPTEIQETTNNILFYILIALIATVAAIALLLKKKKGADEEPREPEPEEDARGEEQAAEESGAEDPTKGDGVDARGEEQAEIQDQHPEEAGQEKITH